MSIEEWREYIKNQGLEENKDSDGDYLYYITSPNRTAVIAINVKNVKIGIYRELTYWDAAQYEIHGSGDIIEYEANKDEEIKEHIGYIINKYRGLIKLVKELKILSKKLIIDRDF